jgi:hypothetical protein
VRKPAIVVGTAIVCCPGAELPLWAPALVLTLNRTSGNECKWADRPPSYPQRGESWIRVALPPPVDPRRTFSAAVRVRKNPQ